jgi:hypothetical protein
MSNNLLEDAAGEAMVLDGKEVAERYMNNGLETAPGKSSNVVIAYMKCATAIYCAEIIGQAILTLARSIARNKD